MTTELLSTTLRPGSELMDPRRLGALQPTRLSASRSVYAKMIREGWKISLAHADVDDLGAGELLYRIDANGHIMHVIVFSREPKLVERSPRIIGSSWDIEGALIDGEVTDEIIELTKNAIPRLYAGRATSETLIWFRANRSIRLFDEVVESLVRGEQPDNASIEAVGYLLRNTGLDGNGTFGTKDFQLYGPDHPLAIPFHAQLFTAYMMREISVDLVELMAQLREPHAARLNTETRSSIAVGNGSALGLVLLTMNRPQLVHAWLQGYETLSANMAREQITPGGSQELSRLLGQMIEYKQLDDTSYEVFPRGPAVAVDLRVIHRTLQWLTQKNELAGANYTYGDVLRHTPNSLTPEAEEAFRSLLIELAPEAEVQQRLTDLFVSERKQVNPTATIQELRSAIDHQFSWVSELPEAADSEKTRVWYKSRNSEEPRSGPKWEVPEGTHDLAVDLLTQVSDLSARVHTADPELRVGSFLVENPDLEQTVGYVQSLSGLTYATPHIDVRDTDFVPAHIIRLFNAFCFGLEKTHDVHQRNLRGRIFEGAHFYQDLNKEPRDWRWEVQR